MFKVKKYVKVTICSLLTTAAFNVAAKPYKGAEIFTADETTYGKFVMRMQAAKGSGVISNFFLWKDGSELENVLWEEVDIEVFGKNNATSWQSNIITTTSASQDEREDDHEVHTAPYSFGDSYHTFTMEWLPNQVRWLVDGQLIREDNGGLASRLISPAQARLNFWPPNIVEWVGEWNDDILPLAMFVNWVEFHTWNGNDFELKWRDDFDGQALDSNRWGTADWTFAENRADFSPSNVVVKNGYLVLAMTHEEQEGYNGTPPIDNVASSSSVAPSSSSIASSVAPSSASSIMSSSSSVSSSIASSSSVTSSSETVSSVAESSSSQASVISGGAMDIKTLSLAAVLLVLSKLIALRTLSIPRSRRH